MPFLPKDQKGIAPVVIIAIVAIVVLAAGGFMFMNKNGGMPSIPGTPSLTSMTLNPNCELNDPDLCKFINNWKETKDLSAKSKMSEKGGESTETLYEKVGEDKSHIVMSQGGKESWNTITIGDTTYTKDYSDNKWWKQKQPKDKDEMISKFKDDFKFDEPEASISPDKTQYKKEGKEACGNLQCFKYQIIDPVSKDTKQYIWFDDREYMMRKMRMESKDGDSETEFSYSGFSISEPSPTKDAKEGQVILPGGGSMDLPQMSDDEKANFESMKKDAAKYMQEYQAGSMDDPDSKEDTHVRPEEYSE